MATQTVTVPDVQLTIEQLIDAIQQLEPDGRSKIAQALLADEMDERFTVLIKRLANKPPSSDITDDIINQEVRAVRQQKNQS